MFQFQEIWLPDGEKHFPQWMEKNGELVDGKGTYQLKKWMACQPWIKQFRNAIDVGSHVGLWAMQMVKKFEFVYCFEPMPEFTECALENLKWAHNFAIDPVALGPQAGFVGMDYRPEDSGNTHVVAGEGFRMKALDSYEFENVDFIKIDCEGSEHDVISGARETLLRCKPCVIVEQKQHKLKANYGITGTPAVAMLMTLGAEVSQKISGDFILTW